MEGISFETEGGLPFTLLSLASSYLDWILMAIAQGGCRIRVRETMAKELLGQEISRQVQQKLTKDMLLAWILLRRHSGRKLWGFQTKRTGTAGEAGLLPVSMAGRSASQYEAFRLGH